MQIRLLTPEDAGEWKRLRVEALQGDPRAFSASLEEYQAISLGEVKRRLWADGDAFVVGAFEGPVLLGMAGFFRDRGPKSRHKGRIWGVYVTPSHRSQRVARKMMELIVQRAASMNGLEQVLLSVAVSQLAAVSLYRSLGFESWGREPQALKVDGQLIDEEYMILRLK